MLKSLWCNLSGNSVDKNLMAVIRIGADITERIGTWSKGWNKCRESVSGEEVILNRTLHVTCWGAREFGRLMEIYRGEKYDVWVKKKTDKGVLNSRKLDYILSVEPWKAMDIFKMLRR